jgi:hypothetical protein
MADCRSTARPDADAGRRECAAVLALPARRAGQAANERAA